MQYITVINDGCMCSFAIYVNMCGYYLKLNVCFNKALFRSVFAALCCNFCPTCPYFMIAAL